VVIEVVHFDGEEFPVGWYWRELHGPICPHGDYIGPFATQAEAEAEVEAEAGSDT
jgi:hypothetical protein